MKEEVKQQLYEVYFWLHSNTGCFHNMLYALINKADLRNRELLRAAFPAEVEAYELWYEHGTQWLKETLDKPKESK
jgi:hypothetical protein